MIRTIATVVVLLVASAVAAQEELVAEMRALAKASYARDSSYEIEAVKAFFAAGATPKCAPAGRPAPEPFEVFLEVLPNGSLGRIVFVPHTETAQCVKTHTAGISYPKPPFKYVAHIHLSFKR